MSKYVCLWCKNIFNKEDLINKYCPVSTCYADELIEVDDQMADIIIKLNSINNFKTLYCCVGHLYEPVFQCYVMLQTKREDIYDYIIGLKNGMKREEMKEFFFSWEIEIREDNIIFINAEIHKDNVYDKIRLQSLFLNVLYTLYDNFKER